nr:MULTISPECIES: hypothetical protein [unclassified Allomuricauda]|tara:strand:- start:2600 stop:2812 length:213 start_codon:yes stop_codon:yes gene_type:complete
MKNVFFALLLFCTTFTLMSFTSVDDKSTFPSDLQNNSFKCILYRAIIGDNTAGCGGGARVCCANTNLNFA